MSLFLIFTGLFESLSIFTPLLIFSISPIFIPNSAKLMDNPQLFIKLYHCLNANWDIPTKIFLESSYFLYKQDSSILNYRIIFKYLVN